MTNSFFVGVNGHASDTYSANSKPRAHVTAKDGDIYESTATEC